jgi:hypothetical protein
MLLLTPAKKRIKANPGSKACDKFGNRSLVICISAYLFFLINAVSTPGVTFSQYKP